MHKRAGLLFLLSRNISRTVRITCAEITRTEKHGNLAGNTLVRAVAWAGD